MIITEESSLYDKVYWIDKKWRCSYCSSVYYDNERMIKHESQCDFNPENKNCYTCDYFHNICKIVPITYSGCKKWTNLKFERTKKLTLLKNKIKIHGIY